jgi:hypothetical protein
VTAVDDDDVEECNDECNVEYVCTGDDDVVNNEEDVCTVDDANVEDVCEMFDETKSETNVELIEEDVYVHVLLVEEM